MACRPSETGVRACGRRALDSRPSLILSDYLPPRVSQILRAVTPGESLMVRTWASRSFWLARQGSPPLLTACVSRARRRGGARTPCPWCSNPFILDLRSIARRVPSPQRFLQAPRLVAVRRGKVGQSDYWHHAIDRVKSLFPFAPRVVPAEDNRARSADG